MCVSSMVGDAFRDQWTLPSSPINPWINVPATNIPGYSQITLKPEVTAEEFAALKKEVELMKELLRRAKIYDEANNEPDCEMEEKMALLRGVAKLVGIDLDDVIGKKA